jgi:hypothetical protein
MWNTHVLPGMLVTVRVLSDSFVGSDDLQSQNQKTICSRCGGLIFDDDTFFRCKTCDGGDFSICLGCVGRESASLHPNHLIITQGPLSGSDAGMDVFQVPNPLHHVPSGHEHTLLELFSEMRNKHQSQGQDAASLTRRNAEAMTSQPHISGQPVLSGPSDQHEDYKQQTGFEPGTLASTFEKYAAAGVTVDQRPTVNLDRPETPEAAILTHHDTRISQRLHTNVQDSDEASTYPTLSLENEGEADETEDSREEDILDKDSKYRESLLVNEPPNLLQSKSPQDLDVLGKEDLIAGLISCISVHPRAMEVLAPIGPHRNDYSGANPLNLTEIKRRFVSGDYVRYTYLIADLKLMFAHQRHYYARVSDHRVEMVNMLEGILWQNVQRIPHMEHLIPDADELATRGITLQPLPEKVGNRAHYLSKPASKLDEPDSGASDHVERPHDAPSSVKPQTTAKRRGLMPLYIPPHVRDAGKRRLSDHLAGDGFDNYLSAKNLPTLENANRDVIEKLRAEAFAHQGGEGSQGLPSEGEPAATSKRHPENRDDAMVPPSGDELRRFPRPRTACSK